MYSNFNLVPPSHSQVPQEIGLQWNDYGLHVSATDGAEKIVVQCHVDYIMELREPGQVPAQILDRLDCLIFVSLFRHDRQGPPLYRKNDRFSCKP